MKNLIVMALSILTLPIASNAAMQEKDIAKCSVIKGDLSRLSCYDALAKQENLDRPQPIETNTESTGKWDVSAKINPIDDSKTATAFLVADSGKSKWGKPIALVIRCQSNTTEAYIVWQQFIGTRNPSVLTRAGSEDAVTETWSISSDNKASFSQNSIQLLKRMLDNDKFIAQVTPYGDNPITAIFDTTGISNALKPIRETCNW